VCALARLRVGRGDFFIGAAVADLAGWTMTTPPGFFGSTAAGVLPSSTVGLGEATTCCSGGLASVPCRVGGSAAWPAGSVSPPAPSQAAQPPSSARALKPFSRSICAARALVCSLGQEQ
jgi:hypothetical protein